MNFFRLIIITLFIFIYSQKVFSDSHDANIVEKAKEINKQIKEKQTQTQQSLNQELVEEEPGMQWETIEDIWPDYPSKEDFFFNEEEY